MAALGRLYLHALRTYTLPTQMLTSSTIGTTGDFLSQHGVEGRPWHEHDWARTARFAAYGGIAWAPIANRWHRFLNTITLSTSRRTIAARTGIDLALFAPFANGYFFTTMGLLEGKRWPAIRSKMEDHLPTALTASICVFAPAQWINQTFMPLYARPPFMNCVALGFSCFMASLYHGSHRVGAERRKIEAREEAAAAFE